MSQSEYTALPRVEEEIEIDSATNVIDTESSRSSIDSLVLPPPPPPSPWRVAANKIQTILVPSFLQRDDSAEERPSTRQAGSSRISTDWLDGLRGVASFFVFLFHHTMYGHPGLLWGYGAPGENKHLVMQLPFIRLIVHGRAMVAIFFVISGYALSFSPLKFIHKQDHGTLLKRLSSSVFRRGMRLAIPSFTSLFLHYLAHITNISPKRHKGSTFRSDTKHLLHDIDRIVNPFTLVTTNGGFHFNGHLWTIPIEFRGSMILFVTILGLSRCRPWIRMVTVSAICVYFMAKEQWNMALFLAGLVVAESNLLLLSVPANSSNNNNDNNNNRSSSSNISETDTIWTEEFDLEKAPGKTPWYRKFSGKIQKISRTARKIGLIFILILGLYVLSYPNKGAEATPGWMWMASLFKDNPGYAVNVWVSIGSTTAVWAISFIKGCQGVLETRLINYMGKISFSLYLVHGLGNQFIGKPLIDFMWNNFTGREPGFWKECSWLFAIALYIPILIWLADIFWRLVDAPSVTLAKRIEEKCFAKFS